MSVTLGISIHPSFLELILVSSNPSKAPPHLSSKRARTEAQKAENPGPESEPMDSMQPNTTKSENTKSESIKLDSIKIIDFQRIYLGKTTITDAIQSFFHKHPKIKVKKILVSSRYLEKVLDVKLGGSVAQIVTEGFEHWPLLRQPALQNHLEILPQRAPPLASQDLIFPIKERISADGEILLPLQETELERVLLRLQQKNVKRICLHLLFSNKNPIHQKKLKDYFTIKGYEVFSEDLSYSFDEMFSWRRNVLNACLAGVHHDLMGEIYKALLNWAPPEKIYFAHERGLLAQPSKDLISSLFSGLAYAFSKKFKKNQSLVHLGIEKWIFFDFSKLCDHWDSPWGPVGIRAPFFKHLSIQPTQEILYSPLGGLTHSDYELGYEPGPVLFGKAHRPTIFDILLFKNHPKNIEPLLDRTAQQRLEENLKLLIKATYQEMPMESAINDLKDQVLHQILHQIELLAETEEVLLTGAFAALFADKLNKRNSHIQWSLSYHWDEMEPLALSQLRISS